MLPASWTPKPAALTRLGNANEGGYVVASEAVLASEMLISMGLHDDWSFEADYIRCTGNRVTCYDHSVDRAFWCWYTLHGVVRGSWARATRYLAYRRFFGNGTAEHRMLRVGYDAPGSISLSEALRLASAPNIFLKVDIEGGEYRILPEILSHAPRLAGIVIEFHDIDVHRERISAFIANLKGFQVVSVHGNNFGGVDPGGDPLVAEFSFARDEHCGGGTGEEVYAPNHPGRPEIELRFETEKVSGPASGPSVAAQRQSGSTEAA